MFPTYNNRRLNPRQISRAVNDLRSVARDPGSGTTNRLASAAQELRRLLGGVNTGLDAALLDLVQTAERLLRARRAGWAAGLTQALNAKGNPIGAAMSQNILRRQNAAISKMIEDKLRQVATITEQVAPELFGRQRPRQTPEQAGGQRVNGTPEQPENPNNVMPEGQRRMPNGMIEVRGPGFKRYYRENDPVLTGRMIRVNSSNVHSIGFQMSTDDPARQSILYVRYLQPDGGFTPTGYSSTKVAGPTYGYRGVHPDVFRGFQRAISKGIFVWDNLRVRGTIHGHQYPYFLARIAQGYVPRRIQRRRNGQLWYGQRRNVAILPGGRIQAVRNTLAPRRIGRRR